MSRSIFSRLPHGLRQAVGRVIGLVPERWRERAITRRMTSFIRQSEYWTAEQWRGYQDQQVRELVAYAYEKVPYYRETWKALQIAPADISGVDSLTMLPRINNAVVRENFDAMRARGLPARQAIEMTTGGTMGKPTRLLLDRRRTQDAEAAYIQEMWRRVGFHPSDRRLILRGAMIPGAAKGKLHYYDALRNAIWFTNFHLVDENLSQLVALIRDFRPLFLHTYPSAATVLGQYLARQGITDLPPFKAVLASSENMYAGQREFIQDALRTRVFTWYGHSEHSVLAGECERGHLYHVFPSYGVMELLDEQGRRVTEASGEGEIVATGFNNPVMPLIRYGTGDRAIYAGLGCEQCGRNYPLISGVRGHYWQEMIVGPQGQLISAAAVNVHDATFEHVRQYQFHQKQPGVIILRMIKADGFTQGDEQRILKVVHDRLGSMTVTLEYVEQIPTTARGKWKYLIQDLKEGLVSGQRHD